MNGKNLRVSPKKKGETELQLVGSRQIALKHLALDRLKKKWAKKRRIEVLGPSRAKS